MSSPLSPLPTELLEGVQEGGEEHIGGEEERAIEEEGDGEGRGLEEIEEIKHHSDVHDLEFIEVCFSFTNKMFNYLMQFATVAVFEKVS